VDRHRAAAIIPFVAAGVAAADVVHVMAALAADKKEVSHHSGTSHRIAPAPMAVPITNPAMR
jgi:hypothetical protein